MNMGFAVIIGAALIAGSIAISQRYGVTTMEGKSTLVIVTDHWTGKIKYCDNATHPEQLLTTGYNFWCKELSN
jgi:hypothetical protein